MYKRSDEMDGRIDRSKFQKTNSNVRLGRKPWTSRKVFRYATPSPLKEANESEKTAGIIGAAGTALKTGAKVIKPTAHAIKAGYNVAKKIPNNMLTNIAAQQGIQAVDQLATNAYNKFKNSRGGNEMNNNMMKAACDLVDEAYFRPIKEAFDRVDDEFFKEADEALDIIDQQYARDAKAAINAVESAYYRDFNDALDVIDEY